MSTDAQGNSGLGLEAQKDSILYYLDAAGGILLGNISIEVESGKRNQRPILMEAIEECKMNQATLLIAKLDRLSRNLHFITELMESKVAFKAVDMPEADNFTIHLLAALAQKEREMISQRTKAALSVLKKNGKRLGTPDNLTMVAHKKGWQANRLIAIKNPNNRRAMAYIQKLDKSQMTYGEMAEELNMAGYQTSRGKQFYAKTVWRMHQKMEIPQKGSF